MEYLIFSATPDSWDQDPKIWNIFVGTYSGSLGGNTDQEAMRLKPIDIKLHENLLNGATVPAAKFATIAFVRKDLSQFADEELSV